MKTPAANASSAPTGTGSAASEESEKKAQRGPKHFRFEVVPGGFGSKLYLDDVEIQGLRAVQLRVSADDFEATKLTLEFPALEGVVVGAVGTVTGEFMPAKQPPPPPPPYDNGGITGRGLPSLSVGAYLRSLLGTLDRVIWWINPLRWMARP